MWTLYPFHCLSCLFFAALIDLTYTKSAVVPPVSWPRPTVRNHGSYRRACVKESTASSGETGRSDPMIAHQLEPAEHVQHMVKRDDDPVIARCSLANGEH